jgi:hypothetical protein
MTTRNFAVTAAVVGASVLAVTGITYASTNGSTHAAPSVPKAAPSVPVVPQAAPKAVPSVPKAAAGTLPDGDSGSGKGDGGRDDGGRDGGGRDDGGRGDEGRDGGGRGDEGRDGGGRGDEGRDGGYDRGSDRGDDRRGEGTIQFNDRTYSAASEGCITAASGLGSTSFSISNDSWKTVEVYRGSTCDNGSPVATVGPHGATHGVVTPTVQGGLFANDGVVGSFRVIGDHYDRW